MMDNCILRASGAGQPLGILAAGNTALYSVAKESGQTAATIVWDNIKKMYGRLWEESRESKSLRWVINPEATEQILSMVQVAGTAGSSVIVASGTADIRSRPKTLLDVPILWSSHASALGSAGDISLIDFDQYLVGTRVPLSVKVSIHRYFEKNQTLFLGEWRGDAQPICPSTIKTRSNFECSPYVSLAKRE